MPVKWIGRQTVSKIFTPAERFVPMRLATGSLRDGLPHTDLVLMADHVLLIVGVLVNAGTLVNGTTIMRVPADELSDRVT